MILEKQSQAVIYETGASKDSIGMSLDLDSAQVLMQMLSKNLYSDAVGSTIRECASNALDSHRRAGTDDPIIVSFKQSNSTNAYEFSVEDFGIGLDADDVEQIISKYGKSTKRDSNTELGMMGLGFKAPLAYCSSFYFVARKNGVERKYMMYEGEDTNTIDLLYEKDTIERNGVKVIIPVAHCDRYDFKNKIKEQLAYFQNVYFNVEDMNNDFSIFRGENYQVSEITTAREMHICLDDVYYPIDWAKIDQPSIKVNVALRFSLTDGLFPTPNRESIRYTIEAKEKIKAKIKAVADEMIDLYNTSVGEDCTFNEVIEYHYTQARNIPSPTGDGWFDISELAKRGTKALATPKMKNIKLLNLADLYKRREYVLGEYEVRFELNKSWRGNLMRAYKDHWATELHVYKYGSNFDSRNIYVYDDVFGDRKKRYVKETFNKGAQFVKKVKTFKLFTLCTDSNGDKIPDPSNVATYYGLLNLKNYPRHQWRQVIQEFQSIRDYYTSKFKHIDDIIISDSWLAKDKASRANKVTKKSLTDGVVKERGDVNGKIAVPLEKYNGNNCKFVPYIFKGPLMHKTGNLTVYGREENKADLDKWYALVPSNTKFVILSDREMKLVQHYDLHNWIHIDKFLEGNNQVYRRAITVQLIRNLFKDNSAVETYAQYYSRNDNHPLINIIKGLNDDVCTLRNYVNKHKGVHSMKRLSVDEIQEAFKLGNVDPTIIDVFKRTNALLKEYRFIDAIIGDRKYHKDSAYKLIFTQLCRYNKIRMTIENYNITEGWQPVDVNGQFELFVA